MSEEKHFTSSVGLCSATSFRSFSCRPTDAPAHRASDTGLVPLLEEPALVLLAVGRESSVRCEFRDLEEKGGSDEARAIQTGQTNGNESRVRGGRKRITENEAQGDWYQQCVRW